MARANLGVWGDSIAWGANDFEKGGRVARLWNHYLSKDLPLEVYNLGISGDSTADVIKRFESESSSREIDIVIFAIGINDTQYLDAKQNRVSLKEFQNNINKLYTLAQKFTKNIIFLSLTKVDESKTTPIPRNTKKSFYMKDVLTYNDVIKSFCMQNGVSFIDVFDYGL
ncbi:MAG: GDSL-type esterase/lipase family protein, partial [Candidatus Absconditabacterales bacterium]